MKNEGRGSQQSSPFAMLGSGLFNARNLQIGLIWQIGVIADQLAERNVVDGKGRKRDLVATMLQVERPVGRVLGSSPGRIASQG